MRPQRVEKLMRQGRSRTQDRIRVLARPDSLQEPSGSAIQADM